MIQNHSFRFMAVSAICLTLFSCKKETPLRELPDLKLPQNRAVSVISIPSVKSGPLGVCYVEVNYADIRNVGKYTLNAGGKRLFDMAIIFAANINRNASTGKAELYFNENVANVLNNKATYIEPLQAKGIKVTLSVLGNHQGMGISNLANQADAQAFAQQLSNAVTTYGLDGIDFDDEYSDYGVNGTGQPNASSFVYLVTALRELMPTKLITFYYYGPAASRLSFNGVTVGSKIDYSWNAMYGTYSVPNVPGLTASNLGPAAIDIQATSSTIAANLATQTKNNNYGVYLYYNLPNSNVESYLSSISNVLYNTNSLYNSGGEGTTGVNFYQDANYRGATTNGIPKGTYTLTQLESYGFINDWASSVRIPQGWTVTMYADNNSTGTSWVLSSNHPNFTTLSPNANDLVTSIKIQ